MSFTSGLSSIFGSGRGARFSCLLKMIMIEMRITQTMDELARLQAADLRRHHNQQRIRGNIKWHANKYIS